MKTQLFTIVFLVLSLSIFAQDNDVNWMSMEEALEAQKKEPRKILIDAYTDWCYPCVLMDKHTYGNAEVANFINKNYYAVKFNAEGDEKIIYKNSTFENPQYDSSREGKRNYQHDFAKHLQIYAYPTTGFFDETGEFITPIPGYLKPTQIELYLRMMESDDYKKIKSEEDMKAYYQRFEPRFKD